MDTNLGYNCSVITEACVRVHAVVTTYRTIIQILLVIERVSTSENSLITYNYFMSLRRTVGLAEKSVSPCQ